MTEQELYNYIGEFSCYHVENSFSTSIFSPEGNCNSEIRSEIFFTDEMEEGRRVGHIRSYLINLDGAADTDLDTFDLFDERDATADLYGIIFDEGGDFRQDLESMIGDILGAGILLVDDLQLLPNFNNDDLKVALVYRMVQRLSLGCALVFLAADFLWAGRDGDVAAGHSLIRDAIETMGFREVHDGLMVLNPALRHPLFEEVMRAMVSSHEGHSSNEYN